MKKTKLFIGALLLLGALLLSLPFLVPHTGFLALLAFVPILCAERLADGYKIKNFFWWYFAAFTVFTGLTTWWVCMATVGGGIFAVVFNSLQMALIFKIFRHSKTRLKGALSYIFLAVMWIAWERWYMLHGQIAFPWIILGNAFARSVSLVQWYELTGILGGSLWVWVCNLSVFGLMVSLSEGLFFNWNPKARIASVLGAALALLGPIVASEIRYFTYEPVSDGTLKVSLAQSNFDPFQKLRHVPQSEQNAQVVGLFREELSKVCPAGVFQSEPRLLMLPETFTSGVIMNDPASNSTWRTFNDFLQPYSNVNLLFGASTYSVYYQHSKPSILARKYGNVGWYESHNTAFMTDPMGRRDYVHKNKLVVGTELTPYPAIFAPLDDALGGLMGRCVGQNGIVKTLNVYGRDSLGHITSTIPVGTPICYESIYSEYCTDYIRAGAKALAVITNDGWWGNTPGYRQHFSYSRLRAIETRRDVARCANTGISGHISQRGEVLAQSGWWVPQSMSFEVNLSSAITPFVKYGDVTGRACTFMFLILLLLSFVIPFSQKR